METGGALSSWIGQITLDTYSHLLPGMGDEAAGAMERIFS
jgi:hypothetical protein